MPSADTHNFSSQMFKKCESPAEEVEIIMIIENESSLWLQQIKIIFKLASPECLLKEEM